MKVERITTAMLRNLRMGETAAYELPDAGAINSAKTIAYRLQYSLGCRFKMTSDSEKKLLVVTKTTKAYEKAK
ncbi:MAG: hypothetical protein K2L21_00455 [Muribaculaceae bacterium]|nr:hypothetical protein [Muribaculaceae bacterium]